MSTLAKLNLFVGDGPPADEGGHIRYGHGDVHLLRGTDQDGGFREDSRGEPWLILARGSWWPVMVKLDARDIERLKAGLKRL